MTDLYESLKSFSDFEDFTNPQHYVPVPDSWSVLVAHIVGAADAAQAGKYRDVNTVGAAAVAAVQNAIKDFTQDFPYVLGGDTATIVLPESCRLAAVDALLGLRRMVRRKFKLEMIVQSMFVLDIYQGSGRTVEMARYEVYAGKCVAIFRGGGLAYAENRIKNNPEGGLVGTNGVSKAETVVSLDGLSCRWNKLPAKHGCILSLVVCDNPAVEGDRYQYVLLQIDAILNHDSTKGNPVHIELARYKGILRLLWEERRFHPSVCSLAFLWRTIVIILCVIIFKFELLTTFFFDGPSYAKSMHAHTDFRKFDGMLRMVLDCTKDQANAIEFVLQDLHQNGGRLYYGLFKSSHSVMTCLVGSPTDGDHIHFVDGDNGGYAMAAKRLRDQIDAQDSVLPKLVVHHLIPDTVNGDASASWNDDTSLDCDLELGMSDGSLVLSASSQWSIPPPLCSLPSHVQQSSSSLNSQALPNRQPSARGTTLRTSSSSSSLHSQAIPNRKPSARQTTAHTSAYTTTQPTSPTTALSKRSIGDEDGQLYCKTKMPSKRRRVSPSTMKDATVSFTGTSASSLSRHGRGTLEEDFVNDQEETVGYHQPAVFGEERLLVKPSTDDDHEKDKCLISGVDEKAIKKKSKKKKKSKRRKHPSKKKGQAVDDNVQESDAALEVATLLLQQCARSLPPKPLE